MRKIIKGNKKLSKRKKLKGGKISKGNKKLSKRKKLKGGKISKGKGLKGGADFNLLNRMSKEQYKGKPTVKVKAKAKANTNYEDELSGFGFGFGSNDDDGNLIDLEQAQLLSSDHKKTAKYIKEKLKLELLSTFFHNIACEYINHLYGFSSHVEVTKKIKNSIKYMEALPNLDAVNKWYKQEKIAPMTHSIIFRSQLKPVYYTKPTAADPFLPGISNVTSRNDIQLYDNEKNKIIKYETLKYLKTLDKDDSDSDNNVFKKEIIEIEKAENEGTLYKNIECD